MLNNPKLKKILNIVGNVLLYVFIFLCLVSVFITISAKKDEDGTATIFGYQMRTVLTSSMDKCEMTDVSKFEIKHIPVGAMVFIEVVPENDNEAKAWYDDLDEGDVLTFKYVYDRQVTITHRITDITPKDGGGYIIQLEGDNKNDETGAMVQIIDTTEYNSPNYVIGKVVGQSYIIGLLFTAIKSPVGLVFMVIVPCLVIMGYEIIKLIKLANEDKKKKEDEQKAAQQNELDELRKRLAELESLKTSPSPAEESTDDSNGID